MDPQDGARSGLVATMAKLADLAVVAEARDCGAAQEAFARTRPQLIVAEVDLPDGDGIELCQTLRQSPRRPTCVLFTRCADPLVASRAKAAGASAFIVKRAPLTAVVHTLRLVGRGSVPDRFVVDVGGYAAPSLELLEARLTTRQCETYQLLTEGLSNAQMAALLGVSTSTVRNHMHQILSKLHLGSRTQAIAYASHLRVAAASSDGWT